MSIDLLGLSELHSGEEREISSTVGYRPANWPASSASWACSGCT